ncbi:TPA: hypothetical protein QEM49_003985 [Pseudomonas putida]|uniref:hypothetical protein n=1 Tax=Pseudomonas putida TaxID=303 RepID=UPI00125CE988|nr:hypothetical protein [Pseudomonas putida]MDD2009593.1 hypothetical protein [Pseudomonas putida]HDS1779437.1 hypothetical protein [Pseudomonas putida]
MIFTLEIDGKLKKCNVHEPFQSALSEWNDLRQMLRAGSKQDDFAKARVRNIARKCVQAGAYEVIP